MSTVPIQDMSNTYIEHSEVITNFVTSVYSQLKGNVCRVYPDNVQYKCIINGEEKKVIPDASINCRVHAKRGNSFTEQNKEELRIIHFPNIKVNFDELFNIE